MSEKPISQIGALTALVESVNALQSALMTSEAIRGSRENQAEFQRSLDAIQAALSGIRTVSKSWFSVTQGE